MIAREPDPHPFVRRIESIALFELSETEKAALAGLPMLEARFESRQDIVRERDRPSRCFAVLAGIVGSYKSTRSGTRQVLAYHVPGDVPDFQSFQLEVIDSGIAAVTACRIGFVRHEALRSLFQVQPRLVDAFWRATLIDGALCREWMLNNGRRESYARMAHLFCELYTRLDAVGLVQDGGCDLPLIQPELGDALGISTVHVSRTLKELRGAGLISLRNGRLIVHDFERLAAAAEFDPTYLHLRRRVA